MLPRSRQRSRRSAGRTGTRRRARRPGSETSHVPASLSHSGACHPPRSNPPLRSSSGPPSPCITPSTVTMVVVVSFKIAVPFLVGLVVVRSDRAAPISSVVARTVPQSLAHLLPPSIRVPSMVLRDGWRGNHRKVARVGRVLRGPSDTCSASFAGHRRARLPRTPHYPHLGEYPHLSQQGNGHSRCLPRRVAR